MAVKTSRKGLCIYPKDKEISGKELVEHIEYHEQKLKPKYIELENMYLGKHDILDQAPKGEYKPDNRIVVNFAKYIVDTLNGYFCGIPIKETHNDEKVNEFIQSFRKLNDIEDKESELSKACGIYGHAYEFLYQNENSETLSMCTNPVEMFLIYDDTILQEPLYAIRYSRDSDNKLSGELYNANEKYTFDNEGQLSEPETHHFNSLPVVEYLENEERQSSFAQVSHMINALNKVISEKANDVDYFADAYMKILGAKLDEDVLKDLKDSRIINVEGDDAGKIIVEFMTKPSADAAQENLISRLIDLIYQMAMVANVNDETFGSSTSGTALEFKLQPMKNLTINKERKFVAGLRSRYEKLFNVGSIKESALSNKDYLDIEYSFTRNIPQNLQVDAEIAEKLMGITSHETAISVLGNVADAEAELERINSEKKEAIKRVQEETGYDFQKDDE